MVHLSSGASVPTAGSCTAWAWNQGGIQVSPLNGQLYLTAYSGHVYVLDPNDLRLLRQFAAPDTPDGIFFNRIR